MLSSAKSRAEQTIVSRRMQEQSITALSSKLKQETHAKHFANWENNGKRVVVGQLTNARINELKALNKEKLEGRKSRLIEILEFENELYKNELRGMIETPEQVRVRMIKRVADLKSKREVERQDFVKNMLDKRFKENADELRKVNSDLRELKTNYERDLQMLEKQDVMVEKWKGKNV